MITRLQIFRIHLIFWAIMLSIICLEIIPDIGVYSFKIISTTFISYVGSYFLFFYFGYYSISLKHINRKSIFSLIFLRLSAVVAATAPIAVIFVALFRADIFMAPPESVSSGLIKYYLSFVEFNFLFATGGGMLKSAVLWYSEVMKAKESEKRAAAAELSLLKSQINPDFLFSTLSGIEKIIGIDREKAIGGIENLAEIMSYMLYETKADNVKLDDEINCIKHLLNLRGVNLTQGKAELLVTGDTGRAKIAPLVLFPFIEDTLKNCSREKDGDGIVIKISAGESVTEVNVKCPGRNSDSNPGNSENIKRLLDLQYGENYELVCTKSSNIRNTTLRLGRILV